MPVPRGHVCEQGWQLVLAMPVLNEIPFMHGFLQLESIARVHASREKPAGQVVKELQGAQLRFWPVLNVTPASHQPQIASVVLLQTELLLLTPSPAGHVAVHC